MRTKVVLLFISIGLLALFSCSEPEAKTLPEGLYAKINTSYGPIICRLEYQKVPMTVANFVALAEGDLENTYKASGEPYFDGLTFHRVLGNFMIQGGDPLANGLGGPGYEFDDEFDPSLRHNVAGTLSMANPGANANGSQFFITHKATEWLDDRHSVFGYVTEGLTNVYKVKQTDVIESVKIIRVGKEAKAFDAPAIFKEKSGVTGVK